MNKTATAPVKHDPLSANTGADFVRMRVDLIDPHPENPRKITDEHPSLDGLSQSIRETGLINPITVRQDGGRCTILAGERRWRAARKAGLEEIMVRVVDVTDEQAFHILTVENLQREDLHWSEEARGVESMVRRGWDVATIAKHVGRSEQWVRLRAKLAAISPAWRKAVEDARGPYHGWPASMLELIARFPIDAQESMLKDNNWRLSECESTAELEKYLGDQYLRALKSAPWNLEDEKLVKKAGACSACPKRSSCQTQLFAEAKDDRCLDASCWTAKRDAHTIAAIELKRQEHPKAILLASGTTNREVPAKIADQVKGTWEFKVVKAETKGAQPAIMADGDKAGQVVFVTPSTSSGGGGSSSAPKRGKDLPAKEQLAVRMRARGKAVLVELIERFGGSVEYGVPLKAKCAVPAPLAPELMALAAVVGATGSSDFDGPQLLALNKLDAGKIAERLWLAVRESLVEQLRMDLHDADLDRARSIAQVCEIDIAAIEQQVQADLPLAKGLAAQFEEDGTPKEGLTTNPPKASPAKATAKPKASKPKASKPKAVVKPKAKKLAKAKSKA